jgi:ATP-binding cassette subfamily B protein
MADRIAVIQDGRVAELGSHEELLRQEGIYAQLFSMQAEGYR